MGLDMFVNYFPVKIETQEELEVLYIACEYDHEELGYFRKHSDLHGYFEKLFHERSTLDSSFNCLPLLLTKDDVNNILRLTEKQLHGEKVFDESVGFFWGKSLIEDWKETKELFQKILNSFDFDNKTLFYDSWW